MNKSYKGFAHVVLILIVVIVAIGGIGYLMYQTGQLKPQSYFSVEDQKNSDQIDKSTNSNQTLTSEWRDVETQYWKFKVPNNWNYINCDEKTIWIGPKIEEDQKIKCIYDIYPGDMYITRQSRNQVPEPAYKKYSELDNVKSQIESITINGVSASIVTLYFPGGLVDGPKAYIEHEDFIDNVWISNENKTLLNQILSTLKFTESIFSGAIWTYRVDEIDNKQILTVHNQVTSNQGNITEMRIKTDNEEFSDWQTYQEYPKVSFENKTEVFVQFKDAKGNVSPIYSDTVNPPHGPPLN